MTTFTISIDEKTKEGKAIIAKLKSSSSVKGFRRKSAKAQKLALTIEKDEDRALVAMMESEETGKLVSKGRILKALKAIK